MKIIEKIRSKLEERRLWKDYIATNEAAENFGKLIGARPEFMSFEEYKRQGEDWVNVLTASSEKPAGLKEGVALKVGEK